MLYFPSQLYNRIGIFSTFYHGYIHRGFTTAFVNLIQPRLNVFFLLVITVFVCGATKCLVATSDWLSALEASDDIRNDLMFEAFGTSHTVELAHTVELVEH